MKEIILGTIVVYKKLSLGLRIARVPIFIYTDCKYYPSCSDYAVEAINKHGVLRGLIKSFLRILKCSPVSKGGVDMP
ncbi:MAG: membrane protein insertion efficiency factor YidD [Candidatus Yanofskybacteria bacterium RIFCSPHIGHO2_01_FULL_43_42]|uniref:Putative membrane protein insertion efficiency factor n=1 Tax=Candidatus Yanofskybacteria bacterium RIFCSPLOWO2_01_FULL_43_22 TaxID=1802695 RepID=A0A1F8GEY3_9BACT|nr:MAG: membrane protein insertion efficiency factor YidD [Candidatus Yanofskybacteria bacterium RIFCSPHIGHO2_01_FULL_43_42]OGN12975.1 MAG: membrane protein insertion efficiency factor YidD [Candidatus Yanofskybacteria bacterium RIFCSPHIGHO2_02_FULL_43_17]OGN23944.1 MAG: membrane protein insertion efficiency factor YidD [Candidatus Yanofskybacteria bacterium RIFCSPLOWO2_01_FULL_43_22]